MQEPGSYGGGPPPGAHWHGQWWDRSQSEHARRRRLLLPVIISLIVQLPSVFFTIGPDRRPTLLHLPPEQFWPSLFLALVGPIALLGARRFPGPVVAIVAVASGIDLFVVSPDQAPVAVSLAFAIVGAVARGARVWAWISVGTVWALTVTGSIILGSSWSPARIAVTTLAILILFGLGEGLRTRAERFAQVARIRAQRRQSEVQAERVRIARELHDVLAHSLSQINVQAGVGLHLMDAHPDKAREALASIKETSKSALDEVRSVLGVLRSEGGATDDAPLVPEPDLTRLDWLAASVSTQGVEVTLNRAPANVPQAAQLAMFRIVQESLTNIVRHAHATKAHIELGEREGFYEVVITDNGTAPIPSGETEGRGLLGMRERAELLGGTLETGRAEGGGFRVAARIPMRVRQVQS
ncbi:MAG TPA: sensor histidine kinase [Galbitalea sp.]|jgi:signal transduction histidine kinase